MYLPPFFGNRADNLHCAQASARMALAHRGKFFTWEEVNSAIGWQPNKYTWTISIASFLSQHLPGIRLLSSLDYPAFAANGESLLRSCWPSGWYDVQQRMASPGFERE